jgi:transcriptional regulator with XRE-family HTH domain
MRAKHEPDDRRFLQQVGARVRDARVARGLTQAQLGDICRLHRSFIGSDERGERNASVLSLRRIASALRIPLADLFGGRSPGPRPQPGPF